MMATSRITSASNIIAPITPYIRGPCSPVSASGEGSELLLAGREPSVNNSTMCGAVVVWGTSVVVVVVVADVVVDVVVDAVVVVVVDVVEVAIASQIPVDGFMVKFVQQALRSRTMIGELVIQQWIVVEAAAPLQLTKAAFTVPQLQLLVEQHCVVHVETYF